MRETTPVFVLGTGRCGTFQLVKMLETMASIEAHHEYLFENILQPSVLYRMGLMRKDKILETLQKTHIPAVHYARTPFWLDSSNALPWIVEPLYELFPNARFIHLLRDGRKVVSSFYHKFSEVMYDDNCVSIVKQWLSDTSAVPMPPPEKKYWRPIPMPGEKYFEEFDDYSRFQRLCYYWQDCNIRIHESIATVPDAQRFSVHLEDLVSNKAVLTRFLSVFELEYEEEYLQLLRHPVNVAIPKNFPLTGPQRQDFAEIAANAMKLFGYDALKEYDVIY